MPGREQAPAGEQVPQAQPAAGAHMLVEPLCRKMDWPGCTGEVSEGLPACITKNCSPADWPVPPAT
jgi:hypothetical protein